MSTDADRYSSDAEIEALVERFEQCTLPEAAFTHAAHLTVGAWIRMSCNAEEALTRTRDGIQRFNAAHNKVPSPTGGYHETITRFYCWAVGEVLDGLDPLTPRFERVNAVVQALDDRKIPLAYYTKARLMSAEARAGWVEPDLAQLQRRPHFTIVSHPTERVMSPPPVTVNTTR